MNQKMKLIVCLSFIAMCCAACAKSTFAAKSTFIAQNGKAVLPVVISTTASPQTKELAQTLAGYLNKISGGTFVVQTGGGKSGLAVGTASDFPELPFKSTFDLTDPTVREDYILRSHGDGIYLIGATDLAVSHAVWDFLYRLGYRDFFPGKHWEVIPHQPTLQIAVDVREHPDFYSRRIWYGYGNWPGQKDLKTDKAAWNARNRMGQSLHINSGHAYQNIIRRNKAEFDKHPEYLTNPKSSKFCVSNPGLQKLVIDWALQYFEENPDRDSVSLEPSDGGGWESDACPDNKVYASISDRVVTLANMVAEAVNKKFPNKYVGIYAYSHHSNPPTIKVNPHVAVGVATAFSAGFDNIAPGWQKQGAVIGVREYYDVSIWSKERPGGSSASDYKGISAAIKNQYKAGARFLSSESSDSWGLDGLGYYVAARTLWDASADAEAIADDFFEKAFGAAQKPMRDFYQRISKANKPLLSADLVGRMYRDIAAARQLTDDPAILNRLNDLALYTRYVDLVDKMNDQEGAEQTLAFAYRSRHSHMVHSYALWRDTRKWPIKATGDIAWKVPEGENPLKSSQPFTEQEIAQIISDGIVQNPLIPFETIGYDSNTLVPAAPLGLQTPGKPGIYSFGRFPYHFYLWVDKAPATLSFSVSGGFVGTGSDLTMQLTAMNDPNSKILANAEVPKDKQPHTVTMKTNFTGLHRIDVNPGKNGAHVSWPDGTPVVFASSLDERISLSHRINMYFYVPKNTKVVGGYAQGVGYVLDGSGKKVFEFTKDKFNSGGYFNIPVAPGQDGKLWEFTSSAGARYLMTVPPYLARSAEELMLPKDVVEADK